MTSFASKIALVTGGASGIGLATVQRLSSAGATVLALDRQAPGEATRQSSGAVHFVELDVTDADAVTQAVQDALARFGQIDVLANCAGVGGVLQSLLDTTPAQWNQVLNVNLTGSFLMAKAVLPSMVARNSGAVVNVGSTFGLLARRLNGVYSVSKAAVIHLTRALAVDLGQTAVRVNCVCPGLIDTPMTSFLQDPRNQELRRQNEVLHAMQRTGTPDEVAAAIEFLASDAASFITGQALPVDGGYTSGKWPQ